MVREDKKPTAVHVLHCIYKTLENLQELKYYFNRSFRVQYKQLNFTLYKKEEHRHFFFFLICYRFHLPPTALCCALYFTVHQMLSVK